MNAALNTWWRARTAREQGLLAIMAGLIALIFVWLLVVRPLGGALDAARGRYDAAIVALAEARAQSEAIRGLETAPVQSAPQPVDGFISRSAVEAGFIDARVVTHSPGRATISIAAARPTAFFAWVSQMEQAGLVVEALRAQANSDQTITAEATFRARGG